MKAKLIKIDKGYYNLEDKKGNVIGTTYQFSSSVGDVLEHKLSKQNCDKIFGVVDVEKLAYEHRRVYQDSFEGMNECIMKDAIHQQVGFKAGFNKAMEFNKDKLFTLEDIRMAIAYGEKHRDMDAGKIPYQPFFEFLSSLKQPAEIEVEVEMDAIPADRAPNGWDGFPKLDADGYLILKTI